MTALALRDDQDYWDDKQLAVLYQMGIATADSKPSEAELSSFLHECQQRKLDPFTKQIYLIGRYDRQAKRKVYRSQTGIDGFRLIARRAADKAGETIEYEDTLWCAEDGRWVDVWLHDVPPFACKVVTLRAGKRFPAVVRYSSYVQVNDSGYPLGLWKKMPDNQLEKCAEAKALRKAFPEELGGIYTDDEMAQADNPHTIQATAEVVSEERVSADPAMNPEHWYTSPAPEAGGDQEWVASQLKVIPEIGMDACRKLWPKVTAKYRAGEISEPDSVKVLDALKARMEALKNPQQAAEPPCEAGEDGVIEGVVIDLDPADPWAAKLEEIGDDEEAAAGLVTELTLMLTNGEISEERHTLLVGLIAARFPEAGAETERAA